jgi:glycosyltransferase involved in cell wall biosynthesis
MLYPSLIVKKLLTRGELKMPLVSVVMLSYNNQKFLSEAIESILGQDFDDFELIIVDDASIDASRQIIQKYADEDPRIRVIFHETNCGISKTANDVIAAAKGKFLALIASDDVWMKDKLSKQLAVLESNEDLIVCTDGEVIDAAGQPMGSTFSELITRSVSKKRSGDIFLDLVLGPEAIFGSTVIYKRTNQGSILFDERLIYVNDWKFYLDLAAKYEFYYMPEPLAQYRIHGNNTWGDKGPEGQKWRLAYQDIILLREYILSQYPDRLSAEAKAIELEKVGSLYYALGQNRKALMSFFGAFTYAPFRRSNLQYPKYLFRITRKVLGRGSE